MYYAFCFKKLISLFAYCIGNSIGNCSHRHRCSNSFRTSAPLAVPVLSILFFVMMGCGNGGSGESIEQINGRLNTLENKLTQLETQSAALKKSVSNLDIYVEALHEKSTSLKQQMYEITSAQTQAESSKRIGGQYHMVLRGETLYSISKKYGLSVSELRQLNDLKKDQPIKAGQKLLIASGVY